MLNTGTKLGPYEILGAAGAGGMGEVYRARDTRLERTVAIKVLPEQFSENPDLKQRFEREARAISSLNHPNICTLYDVGHQDGVDYLVMEYIEGESLAARVMRGPLPVEQTLKTGCEIAEALEKAHRQGIVHRDLKPGNVMLTKSGAKLLDFGLAKPQTPLVASASSSAVVTQTKPVSPITAQGHIVGTFQYMSPEQVEGKEADARSDIFALGAVLYEMATGKRAFEGKSTISVASAILEREPEPISKLQPMTPPALEQVVKGCLAKDPEERFQTAHDVKLQLKWIAEGGSRVGAPALAVSRRKHREWVAWALVAVLAVAAGYAGWRLLRSGGGSRVVRLALTLPRGSALSDPETNPIAVAPDGSAVVYSAAGEDKKGRLFLRRLDSFEATPIPGTEGGAEPFFSPDGEWVGFVADDKLKKVSLAGGSAVVLSDMVAFPGGGVWAPDGTIYFERSFFGGIDAVPAGGGPVKQVTTPGTKKDDRAHLWPEVLPGGRALIFTVWTGGSFDDARIEGLWLKTGERKLLVQGGTGARYLPSGHLIYAHGGTLFAVPFDPDKMEVKGPPLPVIEGVHTRAANGDAHYSFSASGVLAYEPGTFTSVERNLMWMDRTGKMEKATDEVRPYAEPHLSPGGKQVAVTLQSSTFDIWVYDLGRGTLTKVTFGADDSNPNWSPDGKLLAYVSSKSGQEEIYVKRGLAPGDDEMVTHSPGGKRLTGWTRDGQALILQQHNPDTGWDIYLLPLQGDHTPRALVKAPLDQEEGRISPDGKWLAYASNESGRAEIFVQSMSDSGMREQISRDGGELPRWAPSGKELLYVSQDWLIAAPMGPGPGLHPGQPVKLFQDKARWSGYDVAADGRILVARDVEQAGGTQVNIVLHWFDELKQKTAGK